MTEEDEEQNKLLELGKKLLGDEDIEVSEGHLEEKDIEKGEQFGYRK